MDPHHNLLDQNFGYQQMQLTDNYMNLNLKDEVHYGVPSSKSTYLQEFPLEQFYADGSSANNAVFGVQAPNFDPFENFNFGCTFTEFDTYECKPFAENDGGQAQVMDNFQCPGGYGFNLPQRPHMDMTGTDYGYIPPFDSPEIKPVNFVVSDEVSCISPGKGYYRKPVMDKNRTSPRRNYKLRKKPNIVKGQWTVEEDRLLIQLVEQYGIRKWSHIAQMLPGRIGKQCRERWHNHLRPDIKKDTWTEEEDKILIQAHSEIGNKWAEIAKRLPGRTENSIKNHWNATKRRQYSKRKCRSKYPKGSLLQEYIKSLNLDATSSNYRRKKTSSSTTNKVETETQNASQCCRGDRLIPNYEFNEVPNFCFDENMFQEAYSIDTILDDMPCAPVMGGKDIDPRNDDTAIDVDGDDDNHSCNGNFEKRIPPKETSITGFVVKKELDLVEMMSQVNNAM